MHRIHKEHQPTSFNRAILTVVMVLGIVFGIGGFGHGFFEALQGNVPTEGLMIEAIGEIHRMWPDGNEPAFSVIPNYLLIGIAAMTVSVVIVVWCLLGLRTRYGAWVFLGLFVILFLVGGGIGQVIFFTIGWMMALHIHKPLRFWNRILPVKIRPALSRVWRYALTLSALMILYTLQIAIFGWVPGVKDPVVIGNVMIITLIVGLLCLLIAYVSACADDLMKRSDDVPMQ